MKKVFLFLVVFFMVLTVVACNGNNNEKEGFDYDRKES